MSEITFAFRGQQVTAEQFAAMTQKPKKRTSKAGPDSYHRGYRVVGHTPGAVERAKELNEWEHTRFMEATPKQRAEMGLTQPKPWDEAWWRINAPKKTIKAFDLQAAALEASEIAKKAGWTEVDVIELKKGEAPEGWA